MVRNDGSFDKKTLFVLITWETKGEVIQKRGIRNNIRIQ